MVLAVLSWFLFSYWFLYFKCRQTIHVTPILSPFAFRLLSIRFSSPNLIILPFLLYSRIIIINMLQTNTNSSPYSIILCPTPFVPISIPSLHTIILSYSLLQTTSFFHFILLLLLLSIHSTISVHIIHSSSFTCISNNSRTKSCDHRSHATNKHNFLILNNIVSCSIHTYLLCHFLFIQ